MGKRELVVLLCLSSWCLVTGVCLPQDATSLSAVCDFFIFPDHTYYFCAGHFHAWARNWSQKLAPDHRFIMRHA